MHRTEKKWLGGLFGLTALSGISYFGDYGIGMYIMYGVIFISMIVYAQKFKYKINLTKKHNGITETEQQKVGFSGTTFFFGSVVMAIKGDGKSVLYSLFIPLYGIGYLFRGNRNQIRRMIQDGGVPADQFSKKVVDNLFISKSPYDLRDLGIN